jgi:hypothetical protein
MVQRAGHITLQDDALAFKGWSVDGDGGLQCLDVRIKRITEQLYERGHFYHLSEVRPIHSFHYTVFGVEIRF